jgi:hypothetical protein
MKALPYFRSRALAIAILAGGAAIGLLGVLALATALLVWRGGLIAQSIPLLIVGGFGVSSGIASLRRQRFRS